MKKTELLDLLSYHVEGGIVDADKIAEEDRLQIVRVWSSEADIGEKINVYFQTNDRSAVAEAGLDMAVGCLFAVLQNPDHYRLFCKHFARHVWREITPQLNKIMEDLADERNELPIEG